MGKTRIEWADVSWNPVTGCTPVGEGCAHCYAERMAPRLAGRFGYPEAPHHFDVTVHEDRFDEPLRWRKPRRVFVPSMGDLFHKDVPQWARNIIFANIRAAPQHQFLVLTKRVRRMRAQAAHDLVLPGWGFRQSYPNVLLGVSVENGDYLWRIDELLRIPAAGHFVSLEPMLRAVDLTPYLPIEPNCPECGAKVGRPKCLFELGPVGCPRFDLMYEWHRRKRRGFLDWVILGGESGPGARPMHPDNVRLVRDQCAEAGTPFLFKGWGAWLHRSQFSYAQEVAFQVAERSRNGIKPQAVHRWTPGRKGIGDVSYRVGKKAAGRLLDGREWDEYPEALR